MKATPGLLLLSIAFFNSPASAQPEESGFLDRSVLLNDVDYKYQIFVPRTYEETEQWPLILFLHGGGRRGSDGLKQTDGALGSAIRLNPDRWQAIVVFPQSPSGEFWVGDTAEIAMAALDATVREYSVDESRIYLTGQSLGGSGAWFLGQKYTDRFAALVPIAGFIVPRSELIPRIAPDAEDPYATVARSLANTPVWIVHGDADPVASVDESRKMAAELEALGADVIYTELPGVGHNSWDEAYANEDLIAWLFSN